MRLDHRVLTRRRLLMLSMGTSAGLLLAACGDDDDDDDNDGAAADPTATEAPPEPTPTEEEEPTPTEEEEEDPTPTEEAEPTPTEEEEEEDPTATEEETADEDLHVLVGDVVDFELEPNGRWDGPFGSVTFQMHKGHFDGADVYYIRTDASDQEFAQTEELVWVPLMRNALDSENGFKNIYIFTNGADEQGAVLTTIPGRDDYTPAFRIHNVTFTGDPELLTSEEDLMAAADAGAVEIEETDIVVNYPLVRWGDEGLPVDPDLVQPLGPGPLTEEPDMDAMTVTFKLHQCYPGSRYIITDTSAVPMAPMMGVVGSGPTGELADVNATAPITIFVNGLEGPGAMGFQPAVFNESAGHPAWSPFWDHFAAEWNNPDEAVVVTSQQQLDELVESGALTLYNGVPDTHPNGFVVNCPAPILAPNTYEPPS